jgi:GNAT superfamily N-acetyltransferase
VAKLLLGAAERWNREQGMTEIIGNFNFTAMQQAGVVTEGHENEPFADTVWNPPYTPQLLEACGYAPTFPMTVMSSDIDVNESDLRDHTLDPSRVRWTHFRKSHIREDVDIARQLLNEGFDKNPMFVPQTFEEIWFQSKDMTYIIDEKLTTIVWVDDKPAGAAIIIPDIYPLLKATKSRLDWKTPYHFLKYKLTNDRIMGVFNSVKPEFHNCGLMSSLLKHSLRAMKKGGYKKMGMTWIADENIPSIKMATRFGGKQMHRLHLFRKDL